MAYLIVMLAPNEACDKGALYPHISSFSAQKIPPLCLGERRNEEPSQVLLAHGKALESPICFFADDSLLFCRANLQKIRTIIEILTIYEDTSRQSINFRKSALTFSPSIGVDLRESIQIKLGLVMVLAHDKYLGLPASMSRNKHATF